ncbi:MULTISPECIES: AI-2E family transporter [unclassified Wenzhouxiangella]|uniref:AI-2E family transporter n=1 Tax=unclassified Wenzhouxiangella TaxID=2613841 RepID=UPI000E32D20D|nr:MULTISPECIES: AI-2E family transporter [unclassified Wenzhouxiangella]RFF28079.1 AI-2E family transporter [Wenzhouxiangella sp. 15181]RFP68665.1 AI-2E family transporter [Wenzhouxiangella sp. 15190]
MNESSADTFPEIGRNQILWFLAALLVTGWLIWLLGPVLTPFFISVLIAYMVNPIVGWLEDLRMRRDVAVSLVFLLAFLLLVVVLLIVIPVLIREVADFLGRLPGYLDTFQRTVLPWIEAQLGVAIDLESFDVERARSLIQEYFSNIAGAAGNVVSVMTQSGGRFLVWITSMVLVPLVTFYLLRDWRLLMDTLRDILPRNLEPTVVKLTEDCDEALGGFLRGQLMVMISLGLIYAIGLWLVGLNNAIAIGMIAGLVSFVPYLGAIIGVLLAGITAVIQDFSFLFLLSVGIVFVVGQLIESFVLTPKLVGDRIGLHPVLVIFAVMAGGQLFGFAGVLLALPAAAAGTVIVRFAYNNYKRSEVYRANHTVGDDEGKRDALDNKD